MEYKKKYQLVATLKDGTQAIYTQSVSMMGKKLEDIAKELWSESYFEQFFHHITTKLELRTKLGTVVEFTPEQIRTGIPLSQLNVGDTTEQILSDTSWLKKRGKTNFNVTHDKFDKLSEMFGK